MNIDSTTLDVVNISLGITYLYNEGLSLDNIVSYIFSFFCNNVTRNKFSHLSLR